MMKKCLINCFLGIFLLCICSCDKAGEQVYRLSSEVSANDVIILNNLGESISVFDSVGVMHNNIQITGSSPNQIFSAGSYLYVVNSRSNSIEMLSLLDLSIQQEISVGSNKNPMYAAFITEDTLAVSGFVSHTLDIVDIPESSLVRSIDLSGIDLPCDDPGVSGLPYPSGVAVCSGKIFVTLTNLTDHYGGLRAAGAGVVAVIDCSTYEITDTIILSGVDPVYAQCYDSYVIVSCTGHYEEGFIGDGRIELINADSLIHEDTFELTGCAPFTFFISEGSVLYASNALDSGIPRINLADGVVLDNIPFTSAYISDVLVQEDTVFALSFNEDALYRIDLSGHVLAREITGDGPIAMLSISDISTPDACSAVMDIRPEITSVQQEIVFDASKSINVDDSYGLVWDFGDGSYGEGNKVVHSYDAVGRYSVCVRIMDGDRTVSTLQGSVDILLTSPFATEVIEYSPAPGQFINDENFNDPSRALGAPRGGGISQADNTSQVSLGGVGGFIILKFDHMVGDIPDSYDFIVFGNAFAGPGGTWKEPGIVEISEDGDTWFLIPGPLLEEPYTTPYQLSGDTRDWPWGYADLSPVMPLPEGCDPVSFYTSRDDPLTPGIDDGSCGGDAFDIVWALDPSTGESAGLEGFQYLRITTGVDSREDTLGEISTEVDAVADINFAR